MVRLDFFSVMGMVVCVRWRFCENFGVWGDFGSCRGIGEVGRISGGRE